MTRGWWRSQKSSGMFPAQKSRCHPAVSSRKMQLKREQGDEQAVSRVPATAMTSDHQGPKRLVTSLPALSSSSVWNRRETRFIDFPTKGDTTPWEAGGAGSGGCPSSCCAQRRRTGKLQLQETGLVIQLHAPTCPLTRSSPRKGKWGSHPCCGNRTA